MSINILITFILYFMIIFTISYIASRRTHNISDFILGGRKLKGAVTALGAGASDMGGWLLLGLPGAFYAHGINQIWIPIGLSIGAYFNWKCVAKRLRIYTEVAGDALTIPTYFHNRLHAKSGTFRLITAIVILIFFTIYASAGFVSGGILFQSVFHIPYHIAIIIGALIIVGYTLIGGFTAVNWIDFFQGSLMFVALLVVPIRVYTHLKYGLHTQPLNIISQINPQYLNAFYSMNWISIISLMGWGLGYFGQPHILVRFMAAENAREIVKARFICMAWMILALYGAMFTGYLGIAFFAQNPLINPETVFLEFTELLFDPWISGVLLAAVLSAVMSTIAAQLLAASSALTEDLYFHYVRPKATSRELVFMSRLTVFALAGVALYLAHDPNSSVLNLVSYAWAGLGASFGPLIILSLYWKRLTARGALYGLITGAVTVLVWKNLETFHSIFSLYEMVPAFILNLIISVVFSLKDKNVLPEVEKDFQVMLGKIN